MSTTDTVPQAGFASVLVWPARVRDWLDARGPLAWVAAAVATIIVVWPLGLALAAYAIWSHRMFIGTKSLAMFRPRHSTSNAGSLAAERSTGNQAFDAHQAEGFDRLEAERQAFEEFLSRRRDAEDRAEFERFTAEHATS